MSKHDELQRFTPRAREAIQEMLKALDDETVQSGDYLGKAILVLESLDDEVPDILHFLMRRAGPKIQELSALMYMKCAEKADYLRDKYPDHLAMADDIIQSRIAAPVDEDQLQATCLLLGMMGTVPECVVPHLEGMLDRGKTKQTSSLTITFAAMALCWSSGIPRAKAQRILAKALQGEDLLAKYHAAQTLMLRRDELVDGLYAQASLSLLAIVPELNWMLRAGMLRFLHNLGPDAKAFAPMIRELFMDQSIPVGHRALAAAALGSVAKDSDEDVQVLSGALMSTDWRIVNGAVRGLINYGPIRRKDVLQLVSHLDSSDMELRLCALKAFREMGPQAKAAVPALIGHILKESNAQLCLTLAEAIAAIGLDAVDPLIEEIKRKDLRTTSVAARSLTILAEKSVRPIAEKLLNDPEMEVRAAGLLILDAMGKAAAPAIPELVAILDETQDWEQTSYVLAVFAAMGTAAAPAAQSVARALAQWNDEDISKLATMTLIKMGPEILEQLTIIETMVEGDAKKRIQQAIAACKRRHDDRYLELERLSDDNLLRYYVLVAQALDNDVSLSWKDIGEIIRPALEKSDNKVNEMGTTGPSVKSNVSKLAKLLKSRALTEHQPQRAGKLSSVGKKLAKKIRDYLIARYGSYPVIDN